MDLLQRPRRLRTNELMRNMVRETRISKSSLIYPVFVQEGNHIQEEIHAMPGQFRYSPDTLCFALESVLKAGVRAVLLFGIPNDKDDRGSGAWADNGIVQQALRTARKEFPKLLLITDVCLCEYTNHGHCGVLKGKQVDNDETLPLLARTALSHVRAGADIIAPSDMMDGRVLAIRRLLDEHGFINIPILSYAVKYASAFYGPFREAAGSAPAFGDRKCYQMDCHNAKEALKEADLDIREGADMIMVKPALAYLDIIKSISQRIDVPVAAYSVSGEYAMIKAAVRAGYLDEAGTVGEASLAVFRAGANMLITYYAKELAGWMDEGRIG